MNAPILNRSTAQLPADGWHEIEIAGEHYNPAAGVLQVIDQEAFTSIVNRFAEEAAAPNFAGLLVDRDHFSTDIEKPSEALGWLHEVRNRDSKLEGRVEWTGTGRPLVEGKTYKFFSTVYQPDDLQPLGSRIVRNRSVPAVRPLRLDRLALTNDPNNKGQRPLVNRSPGGQPAIPPNQNAPMKNLLKALGLPETATEDEAVAAVTALQKKATDAESALPPLTNRVKVLETDNAALLDTAVEADLVKFAPVIANRDSVKKALVANRAGTLAFLEAIKPAAAAAQPPAAIANRSAAQPPAATPGSATETDAERAHGAAIANRAAELRRTSPRLSRAQAFSKAQAELSSKS